MLFSILGAYVGDDSHPKGDAYPLPILPQWDGVDWVLGDINSVPLRWRAVELGALWCAPSIRIGGHTKMATVFGAHMPFTYHVLTRPTLEYI